MPSAPAGTVETGTPSFVVLGPEALGLSSMPTDLQLLPDGRILVVAQREIALGDGVRWEVFRAAEGQNSLPPLVAVDTDGKIYGGAEAGIARLDLTDDARWHLTLVADLRKDLDLPNVAFPSVASLENTWYWHSGNSAIVSWRPGQTARVAASGSSVERVFGFKQHTFFSEGSSGTLFQLERDGTISRVRGGGDVTETVTCAAPFADGELLVGTVAAGLKIFDGKSFRAFASAGLLGAGWRISDLCAVSDGFFAAAVDSVGLVFFNRDGHIVQTLERSIDHRLGRVQRLRYSADGVLWGVMNDGLVRVEFPSPISHFGPLLASSLGFVQALRHGGKLWFLSEGRAMRGVYDATQRLDTFQEDTPPGRFLFTLADAEGQLFASNDAGIFVYQNGKWSMALPGIVNARLGFSPSTPLGLPYVARGEYGFISRTADGYTARRFPVAGLGDNYNAVADAAGVAWLELGASRIGRFDPRTEPVSFEIFDQTAGITPGWAELYTFEGIARFQLGKAHLRFDEGTRRFVSDDAWLKRFPELATVAGRPLLDSLGRFWYTGDGKTHLLPKNSTTPQVVPGNSAPMEFVVEENGIVWLFENRRLERLDLRIAPPPARPLRALITSVQFPASNRWIFKPGAALQPINYADNSLVLHFVAPANPFGAPVKFEVLLEGAGDHWVSTDIAGTAAFNRLKEGAYTFRVRPIVGTQSPGGEARLDFVVRPPWFRTTFAWLIYAVAALGVFAFAIWFSSFLQRRENERLERLVTVRTEELSRQIVETTGKSTALSVSEERYRLLNTELEARVGRRTAELSLSNTELQQRESLFRLIFEHAPVGISWKRADLGGGYHLNATFRRILELSATSADRTPLATLVHPEDAARQAELHQRIQSGAQDSYNLEERFVLPSGRVVWGSLSVAVVRNAQKNIVQDIGILEDITARKHAEAELAKTYKNLVDASRLAGMAEVATGVLHNVGNVLNSLNVSSNLVTEAVRQSKVDGLVKLATLLNEHADHLGEFFTRDAKAKLVPSYLTSLAEHSVKERDALLQEVTSMQKNIDHIKEIIAMQQGRATAAGVVEEITAADLFEDSLRMNGTDLEWRDVTLVREFESVPRLSVEKGKVLQILVNLIRNAKHACDDAQAQPNPTAPLPAEKTIVLRIEPAGADRVRLMVRDNGIGIRAENLTRIFVHGFTTRSYGHGFGLHSSALAAKEMNGSLSASSPGPNLGATFTLELPLAPERVTRKFPRSRVSALAGTV